MAAVNERFLSELNAKDDLALKLGDTLDVKASIGLVVVTFLGTQTAYLLDKHVGGICHWLQSISVAFLVAATIACIVELWPRQYILIEPEGNVKDRISQLRAHYSQFPDADDSHILAQLTDDEIAWTTIRIAKNQGWNKRKSRWLEWSFYATAGSFVLNLVTIVLVWLIHPF